MPDRFEKDVEAVLDYKWDWSDWLEVGETIVTDEVVELSAGLTIDSHTHDDSTVTVWLSGGGEDLVFLVTCTITTSMSRTDERSMIINCTFR